MPLLNEAIIIKYEEEYEKDVGIKVEKFQNKKKLPSMHRDVIELRELLAGKFWTAKKLVLKDSVIMELQTCLQRRRREKTVEIWIEMGFDKRGKVKNRSYYYNPNPLFAKGEREDPRKKNNVCEFAWVIHREVAKWLPYFTREVCAFEAQSRMNALFPRILDYIKREKKNARFDRKHNGFPLENTVVGGSKNSNREEGVSGFVHWSSFFDKDIQLEKEFFCALKDMVTTAFQHCQWFQFLNHFLRNHKNGCFADRLIPGTPFTHVWLTMLTREFNVHVDERNLFVGILCVPESYEGGNLVVSDPNFRAFRHVHLERGDLIAGRCFQALHCNLKVKKGIERKSLAMYFDYRIACERFKRVKPVRVLNYM